MNDEKRAEASTLRACQLHILDEVVAFCEKHKIRYYLSSGTLLGAARHKGYIPWDDDIDIDMPIEDYRRFLRLAKKAFPEELFVQTYGTDKKSSNMWCQVRMNNTTMLFEKFQNLQVHWGIFIDIFPLVGVYEFPACKKMQRRLFSINKRLLRKDCNLALNEHNNQGGLVTKALYCLPRSIRHGICRLNERFLFKSFDSSDTVARIWVHMNGEAPRSWFSEGREKLSFEGKQYVVPANWHCLLQKIYGDYMTPPPENARTGHEGINGRIIIDTEKDYHEYVAW